jgi:hypothetical protein
MYEAQHFGVDVLSFIASAQPTHSYLRKNAYSRKNGFYADSPSLNAKKPHQRVYKRLKRSFALVAPTVFCYSVNTPP